MISVEECEDAVKGPGKFEGEARYVPYFWDLFLMGMSESDTPKGVVSIRVYADEKEIFPELVNRKWVTLCQTGEGFVCEVRR